MSAFDYKYTCPDIDKAINSFKEAVAVDLDVMLNQCCPLLKDTQKKEFIDQYVDYIYQNIEQYVEDVRESNEEIRAEANAQITQCEITEEHLKQEIDELNEQLELLESKNNSLEEELEKFSEH
jgi:chromosome segregation ATPase